MEDTLFTVDEAAAYLRISRRLLRELYLRKQVKGAKLNYRSWVFRKSDLDDYLGRISIKAKGCTRELK
jgi:excisionase family DNA binding protein